MTSQSEDSNFPSSKLMMKNKRKQKTDKQTKISVFGVWCCPRHKDQRDRIESPEVNLYLYISVDFQKTVEDSQ